MEKLRKEDVMRIIESDVESSFSDEEIIHFILEKKVSGISEDNNQSFGQRAADAFARLAGSWAFILSFGACLIFWIGLNILLFAKAFDPYPFILLNLVLSCLAAVQAPLIMMSQNRQEEKDRLRAENDYKVNLKNELIIEDLHQKLDKILENQSRLLGEETEDVNNETS